MRTCPLILALSLTSTLLASHTFGQNAPAPAQGATTQPAPAVAPAQPAAPAAEVAPPKAVVTIKDDAPAQPTATKGKNSSGADTLSVDFPDEDIRNILRNVADLFELNVVIPDTLQGRTTIKLRDVTWRQIFQVVLTPVGFTYVEDGNIIKVVSLQSLQQEPVSTEVFILNYARAADIKPTLDSLVDSAAGGKIVIDSRSNALVITERPSQMNKIRPIIEELDKATAQVMIESKFVEVTNSDIKNIGVNWSSLSGWQLGAGNISQTWDRSRGQTSTNGNNINSSTGNSSSNSTTNSNGSNNGTTGSTTNNNTSTNTVAYNVNPASLNLADGSFGNATLNLPSGSVTNVSSPISGNLAVPSFTPAVAGTSGSAGTPASFTSPVTNNTTATTEVASGTTSSTTVGSSVSNTLSNTASNAVNDLFGLTNTGSTNRMASAVFSAADFNVIISALKQTNDIKLVSNPTIVTLNNTEASINIGKEYPIPNYTYNQERGVYEVSGFNYRPVGIILKVTPQVNARGFIKLTLAPEVSSTTESANFGTAQIPIITTRKTVTQVSLKDGYTMGIGGLIDQTLTNGQTKVPVLGSIPLLGRLFRSDTKNDQERNLIIFITAKTVAADGAPIEQVFDSRAVRQLQLKRSDLPGYRDGSDPFLPEKPEPEKKKE